MPRTLRSANEWSTPALPPVSPTIEHRRIRTSFVQRLPQPARWYRHYLPVFPVAIEAFDLDVRIGGGPTVVRDFLAANLVDLLHVVQVPILLGRGVRLWDGVEGVEDRYDVEAVSSPSGVTHLTFTRR